MAACLASLGLWWPVPTTAVEGADGVPALLTRIRALANSDRLFEPRVVAKILDVEPDFRAEIQDAPGLICSEPSILKTVSARWTPAWAKVLTTLPSAAGIELPPEAERYARSAWEAGSLHVTYSWVPKGPCSAEPASTNEEEATVVFDGLQVFACVTADAVSSQFKGYAEERQPPPYHGGPVPQVLVGPQSGSRGTRITFDYRSNGCAQSIRIEQATRFGSLHRERN